MTTYPTTTSETLPPDVRGEARARRAETVRRGREERARRTTELFARTVDCDDAEERESLLEQVIVLNIEVAEAVASRYTAVASPTRSSTPWPASPW